MAGVRDRRNSLVKSGFIQIESLMVSPKKEFHPVRKQIQKAQKVFQILFCFYGQPVWRNPLTPLDELISTILSQNTNDHNRDTAFQNLKKVFPDWEQVRDAPQEQVINTIRSAGLANQKGARIQSILRQITVERGNLDLTFLAEQPAEEARLWLLRFKGVGPKTASIVLQFSLNHPAFPVDTHIYRVSGRLGLRPAKMNVEQTHELMEQLFKPDQYGSAHLNIIRLGREVCLARKPKCLDCPLQKKCSFYNSLPV
jgi:endonuclease-3